MTVTRPGTRRPAAGSPSTCGLPETSSAGGVPGVTTYASNLRLLVKDLSANQFVKFARSEFRPPMPWFNLRAMTDRDLTAIYAYLKHLGPAGQPAPQYVPADQTPAGPVVQFTTPPK